MKKQAWRSFPVSYQKNQQKHQLSQAFYRHDINYGIVLYFLHRLYITVDVAPKEGLVRLQSGKPSFDMTVGTI